MTAAPTFSVVIPAYNAAAYVGQTLESLAAQTWRDFEVIVVDDGSSDGTARVAAERLRELGVRGEVMARPPQLPRGPSGCRNAGLRAAAGEWVAFLDSDDLFAPEKLERVAGAVTRFAGAARAFYHKSARFDDDTGQLLEVISGGGTPGTARDILDELLVGNYLATCGIIVERALLRELGGFHPALHGVEDWWLVLQLARRTRWVFLDETLAFVRARQRSLMRNQPLSHYVRQHAALLRVAERSGELTPSQLDRLEGYALGRLTRYFASQALARGGWPALVPGLLLLARLGYPRRAAEEIAWQARGALLSIASRAYRRVRPRRAAES